MGIIIEFKNDGEQAILIVNNKKFIVSEEVMSGAFRYFNEQMESGYLFGTIEDRYITATNGEKYIKEYLLKYVPRTHTCPHCKIKNVDYYHIDRCADIPF